jgi:hypothetical protein
MASIIGGQLTVIVITEASEVPQGLQEELDARLQAQQIKGHYRQLVKPSIADLAQTLQVAGGGTLIMSADNPLLEGEGLATLLDAIDCSVLLVR